MSTSHFHILLKKNLRLELLLDRDRTRVRRFPRVPVNEQTDIQRAVLEDRVARRLDRQDISASRYCRKLERRDAGAVRTTDLLRRHDYLTVKRHASGIDLEISAAGNRARSEAGVARVVVVRKIADLDLRHCLANLSLRAGRCRDRIRILGRY